MLLARKGSFLRLCAEIEVRERDKAQSESAPREPGAKGFRFARFGLVCLLEFGRQGSRS
jgi:hypothetical protein